MGINVYHPHWCFNSILKLLSNHRDSILQQIFIQLLSSMRSLTTSFVTEICFEVEADDLVLCSFFSLLEGGETNGAAVSLAFCLIDNVLCIVVGSADCTGADVFLLSCQRLWIIFQLTLSINWHGDALPTTLFPIPRTQGYSSMNIGWGNAVDWTSTPSRSGDINGDKDDTVDDEKWNSAVPLKLFCHPPAAGVDLHFDGSSIIWRSLLLKQLDC